MTSCSASTRSPLSTWAWYSRSGELSVWILTCWSPTSCIKANTGLTFSIYWYSPCFFYPSWEAWFISPKTIFPYSMKPSNRRVGGSCSFSWTSWASFSIYRPSPWPYSYNAGSCTTDNCTNSKRMKYKWNWPAWKTRYRPTSCPAC